jgi:sugar O-acyltransferase (sialic acid O-acetyltransferase NeuD family)
MQKLVIYGAGGLGREVKSMLHQSTQEFDLIGFLDDGLAAGSSIAGVPVLGNSDWLSNCPSDIQIVLAIGNPRVKHQVWQQINSKGAVKFATLIHQRSIIQDKDSVHIGMGSIIGAGVVLTTGITVHNHVLINLNVTIGHDTIVGDCCSIMPNASLAGEVQLGQRVMIGSGANIINRIKIGDDAIVGAGSVVNHAIKAGATAVGIPARSIKQQV